MVSSCRALLYKESIRERKVSGRFYRVGALATWRSSARAEDCFVIDVDSLASRLKDMDYINQAPSAAALRVQIISDSSGCSRCG